MRLQANFLSRSRLLSLLGLLLIGCLSSPATVRAELQAGTAVVDITPDQWPLAPRGSFYPKPVETAHDPEDLIEGGGSIPLSADLMAALRVAVFQRRSLGEEDTVIEDLVQEAVKQWLEREIEGTTRIPIKI